MRSLANDLVVVERADRAIAIVDRALRARPDSASLHALMGTTLARAYRSTDARSAFKRALAIDANHPEALGGMAALAGAGGDTERAVELFDRAAPHFVHAGERVEIPLDDARIPGYLRLPAAAAEGPVPCCVLIGGLESTKEESHLFENLCLDRGMATFAFDGPGQGELFFDVKLVPDFERYSSAVLDHLVGRPELDADRIGVLGRSLGGHYAPKAAAGDERFAACCAWGACFDLSDLPEMPEHTRHGFIYATGIADGPKLVDLDTSGIRID